MSILDVGTTGAKRVSWEHYNPRELLLELVQNYPNADEATIARHLRDRVLGDESEYLMSILLYYVRNNMRSLQPGRPSPAERAARHAEAITAVDAVKQQVREHIKREAKILLLDMIQANGKPLRQCTGAECTRFGGWLAAIAEKVGAKQIVGDVLTEQDVRRLFKRA